MVGFERRFGDHIPYAGCLTMVSRPDSRTYFKYSKAKIGGCVTALLAVGVS